MPAHAQTQVKVNAFVDEGIADLVEALSAVEGLLTVESCQGDAETGAHAFVLFRMRDWRRVGEFLFEQLHPAMQPDLRGLVMLRITGYGQGAAMGSIDLDPMAVASLTRCVRKLAVAESESLTVARIAHGDPVARSIGAAGGL